MKTQIEFASGGRFNLEDRLSRADEWYASRGLPSIAERRRTGRVGSSIRRSPTKASPAKTPTRIGPTVWIIAAPDDGFDPQGQAEAFSTRAWSLEDLNHPGSWGLQRFGHGSDILDVAGPHLRASIDLVAGLVLEWVPNYTDASHRNVVADLEKGLDGVSVEFKRGTTLSLRTSRGEPRSLITQARLVNVALTRGSPQIACYPGALAFVSYGKDQVSRLRDKRKAIDLALTRARAARRG